MHAAHSTLRQFFGDRRRRVSRREDPADMGTCFGLEMTLEPPAPPVIVSPARTQPWWQRLTARKPAGA